MDAHTLGLLFLAVSQHYQLPTGLLEAVCWVESSHKINAINGDDHGSASLGLCQVKLETARELGFRGNAYDLQTDPVANAYFAGLYLRRQIDRYDGNLVKAVAAYNAGSFRLDRAGRPINLNYILKVRSAWQRVESN